MSTWTPSWSPRHSGLTEARDTSSTDLVLSKPPQRMIAGSCGHLARGSHGPGSKSRMGHTGSSFTLIGFLFHCRRTEAPARLWSRSPTLSVASAVEEPVHRTDKLLGALRSSSPFFSRRSNAFLGARLGPFQPATQCPLLVLYIWIGGPASRRHQFATSNRSPRCYTERSAGYQP